MIPRIVHYCWLGRGKMPRLAMRCIESWRKYLPDYDLRLWNTNSFDVNSVPYVKEAYEAGKFAFAADYVRLFAIYQFGGVYMDSDVEVIKPLDKFLQYPAFSGFESEDSISAGILGSEQAGAWAKEQLGYYDNRHFRRSDGSLDLTTNVKIISTSMAAHGFKLNNTYQIYNNCMHVFPQDFFSPKSHTGMLTITENTCCIHHFAGGWESPKVKAKMFIIRKVLGPALTQRLIRLKRKLLRRRAEAANRVR